MPSGMESIYSILTILATYASTSVCFFTRSFKILNEVKEMASAKKKKEKNAEFMYDVLERLPIFQSKIS